MTFSWKLVGRADCLGAAAKARECLARAGGSPRAAGELAVVVAELAYNAIRHAGGGECVLEVSRGEWSVTVRDEGPGFPPNVLADCGRTDGVQPRIGLGSGLACARRFAGSLAIENLEPTGARVIARKQHLERGAT
ncbi:MAG: ATP-binding protein [Myxococcaceae bacterium]|nr:ATP-binding protein [Myxococcaceae bacterium]